MKKANNKNSNIRYKIKNKRIIKIKKKLIKK